MVRPSARITGRVDRKILRSLRGTHPHVVDRAKVGNRLHAETLLQHMVLVLQPSEDQRSALTSLLDAQQDRSSDRFHQWLTPDTFAQSFGVAPSDIAQVTAWLSDSGLQVESVSRSGRFITFSGTAGAVEAAFNTEMHKVTVDGEEHISNITDLSVPEALSPVVKGVARLNNFFPKAGATRMQRIVAGTTNAPDSVELAQPDVTSSGGTHYVGPADLATIYNARPLTQAGVDGTGITIAVIARSNISLSDVTTFRSMFSLKSNNPNVIVVGADPGLNDDEVEAALDAEMAGALAPGATVNFIVSSSSLIGEGIDTAALYAVDNNAGDIITLSYGGCETSSSSSGAAFWNDLWQEAAAQGQTVFVATGDSGAAGCASSGAQSAPASTVAVNALGSSAYNVAVGGTMFVDYGPTQYWTSSNSASPYATALSYVPEAAWNEGRLTTTDLNAASTAAVTGSGIWGTGGGVSIYTARPSWQTGSGISATADPTPTASGSPITGLHRLVPDLSFVANSGHEATIFCVDGGCSQNGSGGLASFNLVGGTSVAAPAMASAQALIDAANGGRQGNANYYYYALANRQYTSSTTACEAANGTAGNPTATLPASTCSFHDVIAGSNMVPTSTSGSNGFGFTAQPGFDETTGLGSVNIANVAANWSSVTFNATTTSLSLTPTTCKHGASQTVSIQVASSTGTPTGDVSLIASSLTATGAPVVFALVNGAVSGVFSSPLPAGSYTVYAHYAGDGVYAPSDSAPVSVNISKENSRFSLFQMDSVTSSGRVAQGLSSVVFGAGEIYLDTQLRSASGDGTPSGNVTYTVLRNGSPLSSLTTSLDTYGTSYLLSGPPYPAFFLAPNYATLPGGAYSITASYAGDSSFSSSSATLNFTVTPATSVVTYTTTTPNISPGDTATFNISIPVPASAPGATGAVTFTDTTTSAALGSATVSNGTATFSTNAITSSGAHSISAAYSGDASYSAATPSPVTVTVQSQTATTTTLTSTAGTVDGTPVILTATVNPPPSNAASVSFYDAGVLLGSAAISTTTGKATLSVANFTGGTHSLSAVYGGDSTHQGSTGTLSLPVARNTTTLALTVPATATYGSAATFSGDLAYANATGSAPPVALTGVVSFYDGSVGPSTLLGSVAPVFGAGANPTDYFASFGTSSLGVGSHTIIASYAGDASYVGSTSAKIYLNVARAPQTITFVSLPATATWGAAGPYTLDATASSGLPVTYTVYGPATLSGTTLTVTGPGSVAVTASQSGNTNYSGATPVTQKISVAKADQTISFTGLPSTATFGSAGPYTLGTTATSGLAVTYSVSGPATLSGSTLTITGAGTVTVKASQAGNTFYNAAGTVASTITIAKEAQTITFTGLPSSGAYQSAGPYTLTATASSGLNVTYAVSGPATIAGTTLTITGAGTVIVTASQAGNTNFAAATPVAQTIVIGKPAQTITFTGLPASATFGAAGPYTLTGTASSGLAVTYAASGPAKVSGSTLTITGAGTVTVTASQAGNSNFSAATPVTQTIVVAKADQTVTFTGLPATATYLSSGPYTLNGTASSGLAVTYTVSGPGKVSGTTLTITGGGALQVTASQAGTANYNAATPVTQTMSIAPAAQTLTFTGLPATATYKAAGPYTLNGTASSGLAVTYTFTGPATVYGKTLTITGGGTVTVTASQAGNASYSAATPVTQTINIAPASQTLTFTGLPASSSYGGASFSYSLNGTASSGLAVTYSVTGPATLSGSKVSITGAGAVSITASQAGNANYSAAVPVTQTIAVGALSIGIASTIAAQSDGSYLVSTTMTNQGTGTAPYVQLYSVTVGKVFGTPASQSLGSIDPGASATGSVSVAAAAGASGSSVVLKVTGICNGATFSSSANVTLP